MPASPLPAEFEYAEAIPIDHRATDGHFVGNPIIPGALILEHVRVAFAQWRPHTPLDRIVKAQNMHPLRPGKTLRVWLYGPGPQLYRFVCLDSDDNQIAAGEIGAAAPEA